MHEKCKRWLRSISRTDGINQARFADVPNFGHFVMGPAVVSRWNSESRSNTGFKGHTAQSP